MDLLDQFLLKKTTISAFQTEFVGPNYQAINSHISLNIDKKKTAVKAAQSFFLIKVRREVVRSVALW